MLRRLSKKVKKIFRNVNITVEQISYGGVLEGKKVLIVGGNSGIGLCIAKKCISEGAYVIIVGSNKIKCEKAVEVLGNTNCRYEIIDLNHPEVINRSLDLIYSKIEGISHLVYNAGYWGGYTEFTSVTTDIWDKHMNVNLKSAYFVTQYFINSCLKENRDGTIVYTSSDWIYKGWGAAQPYAISKGSLISLMSGITKEYYRYGIRINAVAPGETATEMNGLNPEKNMYADLSNGRNFRAEEIAEVVFFLLSGASKCISGTVIPCDGGDFIR